jgi:GTP-binding protein Era
MWDGTEIRKEDEELFTLLGREERTIWVVNKIDAVPPADKKKFQEEGKKRGKEVFLISSVTGEGILELLSHIFQLLPISPPLYPGDMVTDLTLREICEEYIREALFHHLREELPYECWVEIEEFLEEKDPVYIRAIIRTNRENQKKMVIGEDGKKIREIGIYARTLMEKLLGRKVYLDLWVKVDRGWKKKEPLLRHLTSLPSDKGWRTSPFYRRWLEKER